MKYKLLLLFLSVFFLVATHSSPVNAADEQTGAGLDQRWVCLSANRSAGHEVTLTKKENAPPIANADTYIAECVATPTGRKCTTGLSELDLKIFGADVLADLQKNYTYVFNGMTPPANPVKSGADGNIGTIKWADRTPKGMFRNWMAMNYFNNENLKCGTPGGQQQCTFKFNQVANNCTKIAWDPFGIVFDATSLEPLPSYQVKLQVDKATKAEKAANTRKWADANNLNGTNILPNPRPATLEDGYFSFDTFNGNYQLLVFKNGANTASTGNNLLKDTRKEMLKKVNSNWAKAYGFRLGETKRDKSAELFFNGDVVEVKNGLEHRDVPLASQGAPYIADRVTLMDGTPGSDDADPSGYQIKTGKFSHPFTKVCISTLSYDIAYDSAHGGTAQSDVGYKCPVADAKTGLFTYNGKQYSLLGQTQADNTGIFTLTMDLKPLFNNLGSADPNDARMGRVRGEKVLLKDYQEPASPVSLGTDIWNTISNAVKPLFLVKTIYAQTVDTSKAVEPILNYLEGYAYDERGNVLPNAKVDIFLSFAGSPYYETTADVKGYYKITSEHLPMMAYRIVYTMPTGQTIATKPQTFLTQNKKYLTENKINPFTYKNEQGNTTEEEFPVSGQQMKLPTNSPQTQAQTSATQSSMLLTIVVLILLIVAVGGFMGFYLLKKKKESTLPPIT